MTHRQASIRFALACLCAAGIVAQGTADAAPNKKQSVAAARLRAKAGADTRISLNPATGVARFVSVPAGRAADLAPVAAGAPAQKASAFFQAYADAFGIRDAASELALVKTSTDKAGMTHLDYAQVYAGVPVFAGVLKAHFDRAGALRTVNGVFVPDINVSPIPLKTAADAGQIALALVSGQKQATVAPSVRASRLYVYRTGLARGLAGQSHLAYEIEVGNGRDVRELVYVDAHSGEVIDQVTGIHEALVRRVYDGGYGPAFEVWNEGDPLPHPDTDINNIIEFTGDTYDLYFDALGRDSYTGTGQLMEIVNDDPGISCPNANWNGVSTNYCTGVTGDDTVAHEWTHAYTQYTHNLIYQWQPGALNEAYSDIFGETVDTVNGPNLPDTLRTAGNCSNQSPPVGTLIINSPVSIAGTYVAQSAQFGPALTPTGVTGNVVLAVDGTGPVNDGCEAFTNGAAISGNVALVDRGLCNFTVKVKNAQLVGAIAVIVANNVSTGLPGMGGSDATITIPSLGILQADGNSIKANIPTPGVNATLRGGAGSDNSFRWLSGEDDAAFGGAIRDLWNPTCYGDPARVDDLAYYTCAATDSGGVHTNSGVPNHGFALMVDGGTYNSQTVTGLGYTKAVHIYFRAMTVYQNPATDFADHADALETSCADLVALPLIDVFGGLPQILTLLDCAEVADAMLAVSMRTPPTQCNFQPLLQPGDPPVCAAGQGITQPIFFDDFETAPAWTVGRYGTTVDFTPRDWSVATPLPDGRPGSAFFAPNPDIGTCDPGGDETGVLTLTSPVITVPAAASPRLAFDHWIASEPAFDGGNVKISVDGGVFTLIADGDYTFNSYNSAIVGSATNPMAGEAAFTGTDGGSVLGSWGRSVVNLAPYASAGQTVQLRFDFGSDGCAGFFGWYVDDVRVYSCGVINVSIGNASVTEGNSAQFNVTASAPAAAGSPTTVTFATEDGTASAGSSDYFSAAGTVTFTTGSSSFAINVSVVGDTSIEPSENFFVNLTGATGATVADGQGEGTIVNDDGGGGVLETRSELSHGYRTVRALNNSTQSNIFWIQTRPESSYEVVVDETSGDIGTTSGPGLDRLASDGTTVLTPSVPVGTGSSRSVRWVTTSAGSLDLVRVRSVFCSTDCGADDTYRLRAYETTYAIPRFNNAGSQITVLLLQNATNSAISGTVYFRNTAGTQLAAQAFTLAPKALYALNTSTVPGLAGQGGTVTVTHDGGYGALAGKTVALEPSTGFSFDSPMNPRTQ